MITLRVVHFSSVHPWNDTRLFLKECQSLTEAGFETHLIASGAPAGIRQAVHLHPIKKINKSRLLRMSKTVYDVYREAKAINADIYHFHDPELIPIGLLFRRARKIVFYDVHEDVSQAIMTKEWIPFFIRRLLSSVFDIFEKYSSRHMNAVITATAHIQRKFLNKGCNALIINNYPLLNELYDMNDVGIRTSNSVCYIGAICENRGAFNMISAIGKTDAKLLLAGQFSPPKQRNIAISIKGWEKVEEFGQVSRMKAKEILNNSMAGLVLFHPAPNHIHALPNKIFEYMSAGIPVIASAFPLWKEIIESNKCGICVDPQKVDDIAMAIQWMVKNPMEAKKMGENGRKAVLDKYNWEQEKEKLIRLYKTIK